MQQLRGALLPNSAVPEMHLAAVVLNKAADQEGCHKQTAVPGSRLLLEKSLEDLLELEEGAKLLKQVSKMQGNCRLQRKSSNGEGQQWGLHKTPLSAVEGCEKQFGPCKMEGDHQDPDTCEQSKSDFQNHSRNIHHGKIQWSDQSQWSLRSQGGIAIDDGLH